ncbi:uncharacterized protein LOC144523005 isoform X1 [Sander vitreus]
MKWTIIYGIFCFVFPTIATAASTETPSALTCNVTKQDGFYVYQLSQAPNLSNSMPWCGTSWEQWNKTVIVHTQNGQDPVFDINLVQNLTDWSVTLKHCHDYLRYRKYCETVEEAVCNVNCSAVLDRIPTTGESPRFLNYFTAVCGFRSSLKGAAVNPTLICFTENWCPSLLVLCLCVGIFPVLGVTVFGVWYCWKTGKCRRRESAESSASYTPAKNQIV